MRILILLSFVVVGSFASSLHTSADDKLFVEAQEQVNSGEYERALHTINLMSDDYAKSRPVVLLGASAHAGICGLSFVQFSAELSNWGDERLFPFLLGNFYGTFGSRIYHCSTAEAAIRALGGPKDRTLDENLFLSLISLAKVGTLLGLYMDANQDATVDAGINSCQHDRVDRPFSPEAGNFVSADLAEIGSGLAIALESLKEVNGQISMGQRVLEDMSHICGWIQLMNPDAAFCESPDANSYTEAQLKGVATMIKENVEVGLGSDCNGDIRTCNCF